MENELKKEIDLVLYENQNIVVGNKEEYSKAGDVLKLVKNKIKFLEDKRKEYTSGLVAQKKAIDDDFKKMQEPLKELLKGIDVVMVAWNIAEQKRLDEEQRKIEAEALKKLKKEEDERKEREQETGVKEEAISEVEVPVINDIKSTKGDIATSTMTQTYDFEVVDIDKVPREYLIIDRVAIGQEIRKSKGKIEIAGIKNLTINSIKSR